MKEIRITELIPFHKQMKEIRTIRLIPFHQSIIHLRSERFLLLRLKTPSDAHLNLSFRSFHFAITFYND